MNVKYVTGTGLGQRVAVLGGWVGRAQLASFSSWLGPALIKLVHFFGTQFPYFLKEGPELCAEGSSTF
jgi:hypothetical protein